jgi:nucleotide-binding universal stress UspA family protein
MILIAYDGTRSAERAILVAGSLLGGGRARVVHVWQPAATLQDGAAFVSAAAIVDDEVARQEDEAREVAEAGAVLARAAGFDAESTLVLGDGSAASALEAEIDRCKPELVVIGSRGLSGIKAALKGSVAHHLGAHSHAPVLIVPTDESS